MKLLERPPERAEHQTALLRIASKAMRDVVVDSIRWENAQKRGGEQIGARISLDTAAELKCRTGDAATLLVEDALGSLRGAHDRAADVASFRLLAGRSREEISAALGISGSTVDREWAFAKAWLRRRFAESMSGSPDRAPD